MMVTKAVIFFLLNLCGAAWAAPTFGIVSLDGNGHAYLIAAQPVSRGQEVRVEYPSAAGKAICCKVIPATSLKSIDTDQIVATNELVDQSPRIYRADIPKDWANAPFVGMAAYGKELKVWKSKEELKVQEGKGTVHIATTCLSQEGVHLVERVGKSERTHLYLSLGYDVERPTCQE